MGDPAENSQIKQIYLCKECGSSDIQLSNCDNQWNIHSQKWEIINVDNANTWCPECLTEGSGAVGKPLLEHLLITGNIE